MSSSAEMGVIHPEPSLLGSPSRFLYNLKKNRSLIYNFIRRDVRIKYRNSILGYIWTILQPLLLAGVYYFVFTIIADQTEELYPIWVLIGVITWQFFGRSLNGSITSISRNSGYSSKEIIKSCGVQFGGTEVSDSVVSSTLLRRHPIAIRPNTPYNNFRRFIIPTHCTVTLRNSSFNASVIYC